MHYKENASVYYYQNNEAKSTNLEKNFHCAKHLFPLLLGKILTIN